MMAESAKSLDMMQCYLKKQIQQRYDHWKKSFEEEYDEFLDWHHIPHKKDDVF